MINKADSLIVHGQLIPLLGEIGAISWRDDFLDRRDQILERIIDEQKIRVENGGRRRCELKTKSWVRGFG